MLRDSLRIALPMYDNSYEWELLTNNNAWHVWKQVAPDYIPSFQIRRTGANVGDPVTAFSLMGINGVLAQALNTATLSIETLTSVDYIVLDGITEDIQVADGYYYLRVTDGTQVWRSPRFWATGQGGTPAVDTIKLQWWNTVDIGQILYNVSVATQFKNELWIPKTVYLPVDEFEEEGDYRGDLFIPKKQILRERMQVVFSAPDWVVRAMNYIRLHDNIYVTLQNGGSSRVYDPIVEIAEEAQGIAKITFSFRINTVTKTGCTENMT